MKFLQESLVELITQTSTNLPPDVRAAMSAAGVGETPNTQASQALNIIFSNIDMAASDEGPICQDTGMPTFYVHTPVGVNQIEIRKTIRAAVAEATKRGKLRPPLPIHLDLVRERDQFNSGVCRIRKRHSHAILGPLVSGLLCVYV